MKIKTSELSGAALDWAVAQVEKVQTTYRYGRELVADHDRGGIKLILSIRSIYSPSTDWSQGGPMIERFGIMLVNPESDGGDWEASPQDNPEWQDGETPLIAACRAIIMDKIGHEVEVPEELLS